jgi:hypothetical protein
MERVKATKRQALGSHAVSKKVVLSTEVSNNACIYSGFFYKECILDAFENKFKQEQINKLVLSMP